MRALTLDHPVRLSVSVLSALAVGILAIELPLRIVFNPEMSGPILLWEVGLTAVLLLETIFAAHTAYSERGLTIDDLKLTRARYARSWLIPDLLSTFPFELLFGTAFVAGIPLFHVLRVSRVLRLGGEGSLLGWLSASFVWNPLWGRLLLSMASILVMTHWIACGWLLLAPPDPLLLTKENYVHALYWAVTTLSTVGYGDVVPHTANQELYGMVVMLLGVGLYGYVVGNAASIFSKLDAARMHHQERLDQILSFLTYKEVPKDLLRQVRDHFHFLWENRMGIAHTHALDVLPEQLHAEIMLFINRDILRKVPMFRAAPRAMLSAIANRLDSKVCRPGDFIIREGEVGDRMFFLSRGEVEVLTGDSRVATLGEGSFFGEAALLADEKRNASVRATDFCELYTLEQDAFEQVLALFPEFGEELVGTAESRRSQS